MSKEIPQPSPLPPSVTQGENTLLLRLRSLRHFFFLSQSSYLSHFLELAAVELRKSTKSAGVTRLQPLLDLALAAEGAPFREDVRVFISNHGALYDWLLKIVSVQGIAVAEQLEDDDKEKKEKEKEDGKKEKALLGTWIRLQSISTVKPSAFSHRCLVPRLCCAVPIISGYIAEHSDAISNHFPFLAPPQAYRAIVIYHVDGSKAAYMEMFVAW
jgi:hypothetical protein